jgi:hypothetical protein
MSTATYSNSPALSLRHYLADLSNAALAFAEALFAAQGRQFVALEARTSKTGSASAKANGRRHMLALANQYQDMSPNLSAELRCIAARD